MTSRQQINQLFTAPTNKKKDPQNFQYYAEIVMLSLKDSTEFYLDQFPVITVCIYYWQHISIWIPRMVIL